MRFCAFFTVRRNTPSEQRALLYCCKYVLLSSPAATLCERAGLALFFAASALRGPEANALPHSAVESRRADADTAPVRYAGTTHRADAECSGDIAMLVMKPISSHVEKLSKVLSDPSLSDKRRYEGVLIEIASMVRLLAHRLSLGVSQRWPVNQFEQLFEDLVGEDKDLDRNGLQSLSSSLSRFQMTEQQRHRLDVLLGRFSAIYGEPV